MGSEDTHFTPTAMPAAHGKGNNVSQHDLLSCQETQGPDLYHLPLRAEPCSDTRTSKLVKDTDKLEACRSRAPKPSGVPLVRQQDCG